MKARSVIWDDDNRRHFAENERCSPAQVEAVLLSWPTPSRAVQQATEPGSEPRFRFHGRTRGGRFLVVIATPRAKDAWRPITCWPLTGRDLASYIAWLKSRKRL